MGTGVASYRGALTETDGGHAVRIDALAGQEALYRPGAPFGEVQVGLLGARGVGMALDDHGGLPVVVDHVRHLVEGGPAVRVEGGRARAEEDVRVEMDHQGVLPRALDG